MSIESFLKDNLFTQLPNGHWSCFCCPTSLLIRSEKEIRKHTDSIMHKQNMAMYKIVETELETLLQTVEPEKIDYWRAEFSSFKRLFGRFLAQKGTIEWANIKPPPEGTIIPYVELQAPDNDETVKKLLDQLVVVKLNGGLGTSMGCKEPKSVIKVREDLTFLDLTLQQVKVLNRTYNANVPLVLMNSFSTDNDTKKLLEKYPHIDVNVQSFCQSRFPRLNRETHLPIAKDLSDCDIECWYPPGHGNFYDSFHNSGLLQKFLDQGKKYVFLSNIDNLGATIDINILNRISNDSLHPEFVMEVTDKTLADVKGGTLTSYHGQLMLLEIAQVPGPFVDEFKNVNKFRIFNTNNLWVDLAAIKRVVDNKELCMEVIANPKHLDRGVEVLQIETAAGAAIQFFQRACAINVPRSRFLPVKETSDLLLLMSNLYDIDDGLLTLSKARLLPTAPLVELGNSFDKVDEFLKRFQGVPNLLELDHLTVSGDVWFGRDVTLKGTVVITANNDDRIDIPPGAILENKIVSGNLRILSAKGPTKQ